VYEVYRRFQDYLRPDAEVRPLQQFARIGDVWERSVRRELVRNPCIIVATSGMMIENTPSAMITIEVVQETNHGIFFVGYLDPDTPGHRLLHADLGDEIVLETAGRPVRIALENRQAFDLSAHATRQELCRLVDTIRPKNVVFVHGDPEAVEWMSRNCNGDFAKFTPKLGETVELEA
jgi:predicted metal-dependent RNase